MVHKLKTYNVYLKATVIAENKDDAWKVVEKSVNTDGSDIPPLEKGVLYIGEAFEKGSVEEDQSE